MAGEAGRRAGLGWLILAAALAVPGFLFYNWWSRQKFEHDKGVAAKARNRVAEGSVFQTPPPGSVRPTPTVVASTGVPAAVPGQAADAPSALVGHGVATANAAAAPVMSAPAAPQAAAKPAVLGGVPSLSTGAAASMGVSLSTAAVLTLSRDPMMSPMDLVRQREAEAERERNSEAMRRAAEDKGRVHRPKPHPEPKIDGHVELQGIVARPDGDNLAIVNGATVNPGEFFSVDGFSAKVKVVRITSSEVTFEYKSKRFKKSVNAE
jgi:hypothetical protein